MAEATATAVTPDLVVKAYEALMTGDVDQIRR